MITATVLALLPIVIVVGVATHELRIRRELQHHHHVLPEASLPEVDMNAPLDLAAATEACRISHIGF
jgi:hypothetical protein